MSDCKGRMFWTKEMSPLYSSYEANWIEFQSMNHEMATDIALENTLEVRGDCWVNRDGVLVFNSNGLPDLPGRSNIIKNLGLLWVLLIRLPFVDERARRRTVYHGRASDYILGIHRLLGLLLYCNELVGVRPILKGTPKDRHSLGPHSPGSIESPRLILIWAMSFMGIALIIPNYHFYKSQTYV